MGALKEFGTLVVAGVYEALPFSGVWYCVEHYGISEECDDGCDHQTDSEAECVWRELKYLP